MDERGICENHLARHRRHRAEYGISNECVSFDFIFTMMRRVWVSERLLRGTF
jgi:hypothetical protein